MCVVVEAVLLRLHEYVSFSHAKLVLGWVLI